MAFNLDNFLMSLQGPAMDEGRQALAPQQSTPDDGTISVTGAKKSELTPQPKPNWEFQKRHGLMGIVNGILETAGDAFLTQAGLKPHFGPQHMENLYQKAISAAGPGGYASNPDQAIANIGQFDPMGAQKLYEQRVDDLRQQSQLDLQNKYRNDTLDERKQNHEDVLDDRKNYHDEQSAARSDNRRIQKIKLAGNMLGGGASKEDTKALRAWIADDNANIDDLPDNLLSKVGMTAYQSQFSGPAAAKNADAHMMNASKPRAGKNPTLASMASRFMDIPEDQRTPDQQAVIEKFQYHAQPKAAAPAAEAPAASSSGKYVIRNGKPTLVK